MAPKYSEGYEPPKSGYDMATGQAFGAWAEKYGKPTPVIPLDTKTQSAWLDEALGCTDWHIDEKYIVGFLKVIAEANQRKP